MRDGQVAALCIGCGTGAFYLWCAVVALATGHPKVSLLAAAVAIAMLAFNLGIVFTS